MILNQDFKEFIQLLNEHNVEYLIVGGFALAIHGYPRFTQDIDFWVWMDRGNAVKILEVLADFGFSSLNLTEEDLLNEENEIQLGYPPNRIDLIIKIDGVSFKDAFAEKMIFEDEGYEMNFISLDHLIQNKKASGRLQDLADVEKLEMIRNRKGNK